MFASQTAGFHLQAKIWQKTSSIDCLDLDSLKIFGNLVWQSCTKLQFCWFNHIWTNFHEWEQSLDEVFMPHRTHHVHCRCQLKLRLRLLSSRQIIKTARFHATSYIFIYVFEPSLANQNRCLNLRVTMLKLVTGQVILRCRRCSCRNIGIDMPYCNTIKV